MKCALAARFTLGAVIIAALFSFMVSCGDGSSSPTATGTIVPAKPRAGIAFGYWSGDLLYLLEQCDHIGLWWARADGAVSWHLAIAAQLQAARGCGVKNIVLHLNTDDPQQLRFELGKLSEGGWLSGWDSIGIYRWDEPDTDAGGNLADQDLRDRVVRVRQVMLDTPGLLGAYIGVFFQCASGKRPGIASFDRVGCYRYESTGCQLLELDYSLLRARISRGARLWVIAAGSKINGKEGFQEPACWASYAHRFLDVAAFIAFMWQGGADPRNNIVGIRDEPTMRKLYCEAGRVMLKPEEEPRCP